MVSTDVRSSLLMAGASFHHLAVSDYTGLVGGDTYYAYDADSSTYWAAAKLAPSPTSQPAQVSSQDDGSYLLFQMPTGGAWKVYNDGLGGIGGTPCSVSVPAPVLAVWGWTAGTCQPPHR